MWRRKKKKDVKDEKKRDKERRDAEKEAAFEKEKSKKLPGTEEDLKKGFAHVEKLNVPCLREILMFHFGEPSAKVKKMKKEPLKVALEPRMMAFNQPVAAAAAARSSDS